MYVLISCYLLFMQVILNSYFIGILMEINMELWNYFVLCFISYKRLDVFIELNLVKFNKFTLRLICDTGVTLHS